MATAKPKAATASAKPAAAPKRSGTLRVRAIGTPQPNQRYVGFYNYVRRRPGDVFDLIDERHFSKRWMEWVDAPKTETGGEPTRDELAAHQRAVAEKAKKDAAASAASASPGAGDGSAAPGGQEVI